MLLFSQAALFGVFMAQNAFLFYIFFELSSIPIFFLLLFWGGEHKRAITIRFFLYTLLGGLALLFSIAYVTLQTPLPHSADFSALAALELPMSTQYWLFWTMFLAFAIKMPIFPFHSWQPETYVMAPTQGTMVLSAVMGKMGIRHRALPLHHRAGRSAPLDQSRTGRSVSSVHSTPQRSPSARTTSSAWWPIPP